MPTPTLDNVLPILRSIQDPEKKKDIMSLGCVSDLRIQEKTVYLKLKVSSPLRQIREEMTQTIRERLRKEAGAEDVQIAVSAPLATASSGVEKKKNPIPGIRQIIAVSSGKGGVGKSTVSVNLAVALAKTGLKVGLLDTDVYGPNIPTMMGVQEPPQARLDEQRGELLLPHEVHGVKVMSMGFLTKGDEPLMWRGPMLHSVVQQFLLNVDWGDLDFLIVDMPPGTGDVQLSLTQITHLFGAVIVTTPQEVSLQDVRKAILMFEKANVPILGIVENMSYFQASPEEAKHFIFGQGGGAELAEKYQTRLLAEIPLDTAIREGGDQGKPVVLAHPTSSSALLFEKIAQQVQATSSK